MKICDNVNLLNFYLFEVLISVNLNKKSNAFFILQINIFNIFSISISLNFYGNFISILKSQNYVFISLPIKKH